jgi:hypothetical protein
MGVDGLQSGSYGPKPEEATTLSAPEVAQEDWHPETDDSYWADSLDYPVVHGQRSELEAQGKIPSAVPSDEQLG